jgi:hypothetical protein
VGHAPVGGGDQDRWGGVCSSKKTYSILYFLFGKRKKKQLHLLLSYYRFYSKFTIALICFQERYFIHFEISNKIIGEDRFEGGREIFMFIKRGYGLRTVEKHCARFSIFHLELSDTKINHAIIGLYPPPPQKKH